MHFHRTIISIYSSDILRLSQTLRTRIGFIQPLQNHQLPLIHYSKSSVNPYPPSKKYVNFQGIDLLFQQDQDRDREYIDKLLLDKLYGS